MDDVPCPFELCWYHWIAVRTGDQAGVVEVLGLLPSRPLTFAEAEEMLDDDGHSGPDDTQRLARVFVTPEVDGWTLVLGAWCAPYEADVLGRCTALSVRYGSAHAFYFGGYVAGSAWLITENGRVVRRYADTGESDDALLTLGAPLPLEDPEDLYDLAPVIAASYGVTPLNWSPETRLSGTGMLALTPRATDPLRSLP